MTSLFLDTVLKWSTTRQDIEFRCVSFGVAGWFLGYAGNVQAIGRVGGPAVMDPDLIPVQIDILEVSMPRGVQQLIDLVLVRLEDAADQWIERHRPTAPVPMPSDFFGSPPIRKIVLE